MEGELFTLTDVIRVFDPNRRPIPRYHHNDRPFRVNPKSDGKSIFYTGDDSKNQTEVLFLIVILVNLAIPNTIFWYVRQDFDHAYY
jgi:hypothetical protein